MIRKDMYVPTLFKILEWWLTQYQKFLRKMAQKKTKPEHESLGKVILTLEEAPPRMLTESVKWVTDFQGGQNLEQPW